MAKLKKAGSSKKVPQRRDGQGLAVRIGDATLRVDVLDAGIVRVRKFPGDEPPVCPLIRYGFFQDRWPPASVVRKEDARSLTLGTSLMDVTVSRSDGRLSVRNGAGKRILAESGPAASGPQPGFRVEFDLPEDRVFFGLGDQTRERLEHRGSRGDLWVRNVSSYIPVPLLLTNDGFGLLVNTVRRIGFDLGATSPNRFAFEAEGATLDYYILYGPSLKDILRRYTEVTGKPPMPPKWALGLWFICRTQADAREFMDDCYTFRREGIPCDAISLEPGWMAKNYDFSVTKDWHPERFPVPSYARKGRHNFFSAARRMGFKPGLWLCCDYDLSYEEERRVRRTTGTKKEESAAGGFEQDKHLMQGARRLDPWTRPEEPWFQHLKDFVDQGAEWFKQDGANQVLTHPDRLWGNGMLDSEMHNLYPLLYSRQMYDGFREHTGRRPFCFTPAGWAGLQRYTATWTGDTGGEEGPLAACLNLSMSGHGMSTCDMEVTSKEGIHFGFLLPWAQLNSWNYWRHPWLQGEELSAVFKEYARLRYRLLPYLYSCAWEAHVTGVPMLRAMPLEFPDDRETHRLLRQYLLGPALLVGAFTKRVYLPEGAWYDYWSGHRVSGPRWGEPKLPAHSGGPIFIRAGSLLPMGREMDYVGQKPDDELTVHAYAGADGRFVLYEDDGLTYAYEGGAMRSTEMLLQSGGREFRLEMTQATGDFPGAPQERTVAAVVHGVEKPLRVELDGVEVTLGVENQAPSWTWDAATSVLTVFVGRRQVRNKIGLCVRC